MTILISPLEARPVPASTALPLVRMPLGGVDSALAGDRQGAPQLLSRHLPAVVGGPAALSGRGQISLSRELSVHGRRLTISVGSTRAVQPAAVGGPLALETGGDSVRERRPRGRGVQASARIPF